MIKSENPRTDEMMQLKGKIRDNIRESMDFFYNEWCQTEDIKGLQNDLDFFIKRFAQINSESLSYLITLSDEIKNSQLN